MTKKMLHSKIMIFIFVIFILLFPITINLPDQSQTYSIVLGVGVDKDGDEYEISTQILTSKANQGFLESLQVHSAKGKNILDAVEELSLHLGRISGFGNTSVIVFCEKIAKEGIAEHLDFFLRSNRLNGNPFIIITKENAKDVLSDVAKIDESFNYNLNSLARLNQDFANGTVLTLESFLNNFYSGTTASVVSQINQTNQENEGILIPDNSTHSDSSGGAMGGTSGGGGSSGGGGQQEKKVLSNKGDTSLFVGSKQIATLDPSIVEGMNTFLPTKRNSYTINNVNDEFYRNATVVLSLKNSIQTKTLQFSKNGIPRVYYNVNYIMKVEQILQNGTDTILLDGTKNYITPTLKQKLIESIKEQSSKSIQVLKSYNADAFGLQQAFYKHHPKKWSKFLKTLADKSQAFQKIEFFLHIKVKGNL